MNIKLCPNCHFPNHPSRSSCQNCNYVLNVSSFDYYVERPAQKPADSKIALIAGMIVLFGFGIFALSQSSLFSNLSAKESSADKEKRGIEIWQKHLELSGEKDKPEPKTLIFKATAEISPRLNQQNVVNPVKAQGNTEYYFKSPNKIYSRSSVNLPGFGKNEPKSIFVEKYFDGGKGWEKKVEDKGNPVWDGSKVQENKTETLRQLNESEITYFKKEMPKILNEKYTKILYNGEFTNPEGKKILVLHAQKERGEINIIHLNQETYLISRIEFTGGSGEIKDDTVLSIIFSNYKNINGFQVPFDMDISTNPTLTKLKCSEIQIDSEIDDSIFAIK